MNELHSPVAVSAHDSVLNAVSCIGRTEDVQFSPDNKRLALAGFSQNKILLIELAILYPEIHLQAVTEITSPDFSAPHGLAFLDNETLVVANRTGGVPILKLPPLGTGQRYVSLNAVGSIRGGLFSRLKAPGSVAVSYLGNGRFEVLVCNNYVNCVTRHVLSLNRGFPVRSNGILLNRHLNIPDGVACSPDRDWIAVSNHNTESVLLFANTGKLNSRSSPRATLMGVKCPHGVRFTADGNFVVVADAATPFVHVYAKGPGNWQGEYLPKNSARLMDEATYLRGHTNPEEGGPKGIDMDAGMRVLVATSEQQALEFFDLGSILCSDGPISSIQSGGISN